MSSNNGPFGLDPEDFERVVREAGEGLRDALDGFDGLTLSVLALGGHPSHLRLDPFLTDGTDRTRHC